MDDSMNNIEEEEKSNNAKTQYEKLKEKSKLYKLKRWEKNIMKELKLLYLSFGFIKEYKEKIKKQNEILKEKIQKENDNFEKEKQQIIEKKNESIKKIEIQKENTIKENDKKYREIISYLNSIKNDKNKLIEFLKNNNNLFHLF